MLDDFQDLKRKVESLEKAKNKAEGALSQVLKRLRKEHGCTTLKEARRKLEKLKTAELQAARVYAGMKKEFEKKWKEVLDDID